MRRVNEKFGALTALGTMELAVGQPCPTTCPQLLTPASLQIYKSSSQRKSIILLQLSNLRWTQYAMILRGCIFFVNNIFTAYQPRCPC